MSRIKNALVRALKATAGDLDEIVKIDGLTKQERFVLHSAREICERLMTEQIRSRVSSPPTPSQAERHHSDKPKPPQQLPRIQKGKPAEHNHQKQFANHGKPWLPNEVGIIQNAITLARAKAVEIDVHHLSTQLGRSPYSVASKLVQHGFLNEDWAQQFRK